MSIDFCFFEVNKKNFVIPKGGNNCKFKYSLILGSRYRTDNNNKNNDFLSFTFIIMMKKCPRDS